MNYTDVYETLYAQAGYHSNLKISHGVPLVREVLSIDEANGAPIRSVLDVGCSHGDIVSRFWKANMTASGMDVSPTAIARARKIRKSHPLCMEECFRVGSFLSIPWPDASFDAAVSSDVLEHLGPADVALAVAELARVVRRYVFLLVSRGTEGNRSPISFLKKLGRESLPSSLHLTVENASWWSERFAANGSFVVVRNDTLNGAHHFVLRRPLETLEEQ